MWFEKISRLLKLCALSLLMAVPALGDAGDIADEPLPVPAFDAARVGVYFGMGVVYGFQDFGLDSDQIGLTPPGPTRPVEFGDTGGLNLILGYRPKPRLAVEFMYEWMVGFKSKSTQPEIELGTHLLGINVKLFALTGRIQPYALLGFEGLLTRVKKDRSGGFESRLDGQTTFAARVQAGIDLYATRHWVVNLEGGYVIPTGDLSDLNYGSLIARVLYRF